MVRVARPLLSTNASNVQALPRPPPAFNPARVFIKSEYPVGVDIIPEHNPSGAVMANSGHAGPSSSPNASQSQAADKKPPRPPNAWIIYRSDKLKELGKPKPGQPKIPQAEISKSISLMWRNESDEVKKKYERMAEYAKAEHARMYPNYRFAPMKKADKERLRKEEKEAKAKERAAEKRAKARPGPYYIPMLHGAAKAEEEEDDGLMPTVLDPMAYSPPISCANTPEPVHDDLPSPADEPSPASIGDEHALRLPSATYKGKEPEQSLLLQPEQPWQTEDPVAPDANAEGPSSWTAHGLLPDGPGNLDFGPMDMSNGLGWDPEFLQSLGNLPSMEGMPNEGMPNFDAPPEHLDIDFSLFPGSTEAQNTEPTQQQFDQAENFLQPFNLDMFDMPGGAAFPSLLDDAQQWNMAPASNGDQQQQQWPGPLDAHAAFGGPHDTQSYPQPHDHQQQFAAQQSQAPQEGQQQPYAGPQDASQQPSRQSSGDMMQYLSFDSTTDAGSRHSSGSASVPGFLSAPNEGERQRMSSVATITTERYQRIVSGGSEAPSPSSYYAPSPASGYSHEPSPVPASSSYAPSPASPYPPSTFPHSQQPSPATYSHQPSPASYSPAQYGVPHIHRSVSGSSVASTTSTHSQQQALQPTQPQPYVPPAGAAKVGSRRVGGRWAYPTQ